MLKFFDTKFIDFIGFCDICGDDIIFNNQIDNI